MLLQSLVDSVTRLVPRGASLLCLSRVGAIFRILWDVNPTFSKLGGWDYRVEFTLCLFHGCVKAGLCTQWGLKLSLSTRPGIIWLGHIGVGALLSWDYLSG